MVSLPVPGTGVECPTPHQFVSSIVHSPSVYDTAWLAMVHRHKVTQGHERSTPLFPGCLEFLLAEQNSEGSWPCYGSRFDAILNSLAALLALVTCRQACGPGFSGKQLESSIEVARPSIQDLLKEWDVEATVQVGFEVLVMGLLGQLQAFGIEFDFDGLPKLKRLYEQKMQKFTPDMIYSKQTTVLHSLEALVGVIDFDQVKHHCSEHTGIMASPAATAAYLIHGTKWDYKAELYLAKVVKAYSVRGSSSVPSAFPTSIFEISWVLSSILSNGSELGSLDPEARSKITSFLRHSIQLNNGTAGFAPGVMSDADDTARALMALQLLRQPVDYDPMIEKFEGQTHFRTYEMERNPSFSANCNVLLALLYSDDVDQHATQILKTLRFVLHQFEENRTHDKWNLSLQYCTMLMAQANVKIMQLFNTGYLRALSGELIQERVPLALCRMLLYVVATQKADGSWGQSVEETSYSVLTISWGLRLAWTHGATARLGESLGRGSRYIRSHYPLEPSTFYFWVEKTTFESSLLKSAYCSMALNTESIRDQCGTSDAFQVPGTKNARMIRLLSALSNFTHLPIMPTDLILAEASHLSRFLRRVRQDIVPRDRLPLSKDSYLDFIPMIWTMCNYKAGIVLPTKLVQDMVWLSLLNYQIDEFMETVVGQLGDEKVKLLIEALQEDFGHAYNGDSAFPARCEPTGNNESRPSAKAQKLANEKSHMTSDATHIDGDALNTDSVESVLAILRRYITHVRKHKAVLASPLRVQNALARELYVFLLAHITHNAQNRHFQQTPGNLRNTVDCVDITQNHYFKWIHTTGADDTSCPVSFQYFACLISYHASRDAAKLGKKQMNGYCFHGAHSEYLAHSLVRSLAVMCRMYNDYGSTTRDKVDANVNSIDFSEFHPTQTGVLGEEASNANCSGEHPAEADNLSENGYADGVMACKKKELMRIAEFERKKMEFALHAMEEVMVDKVVLSMLQVFVDVTDTFGLVYVQKDIASSRLST
ncbi:Ent-kaurene synthase [Karstenula rhodostoma CBS 690.94]|uniref:Ent-kaurene synthase n=1 Tax=Karstenula rhodostoma CBS 690.94 TaxID=1392251 RepID=A0A9P4UIA5_9PLEO|nr:Ent-kaurene synthase [Karstenula rhodostoma CBS 690.94]